VAVNRVEISAAATTGDRPYEFDRREGLDRGKASARREAIAVYRFGRERSGGTHPAPEKAGANAPVSLFKFDCFSCDLRVPKTRGSHNIRVQWMVKSRSRLRF
jgi:hypothetical protein